jgi:hypothetical protein
MASKALKTLAPRAGLEPATIRLTEVWTLGQFDASAVIDQVKTARYTGIV